MSAGHGIESPSRRQPRAARSGHQPRLSRSLAVVVRVAMVHARRRCSSDDILVHARIVAVCGGCGRWRVLARRVAHGALPPTRIADDHDGTGVAAPAVGQRRRLARQVSGLLIHVLVDTHQVCADVLSVAQDGPRLVLQRVEEAPQRRVRRRLVAHQPRQLLLQPRLQLRRELCKAGLVEAEQLGLARVGRLDVRDEDERDVRPRARVAALGHHLAHVLQAPQRRVRVRALHATLAQPDAQQHLHVLQPLLLQ
mmetsp:Transcript_11462/g.39957  ORF Transcript_11462/g.39957 Transcript_11462/m.39957 type:complete len:253 (-) Transcript_11462:1411-2169(-)